MVLFLILNNYKDLSSISLPSKIFPLPPNFITISKIASEAFSRDASSSDLSTIDVPKLPGLKYGYEPIFTFKYSFSIFSKSFAMSPSPILLETVFYLSFFPPVNSFKIELNMLCIIFGTPAKTKRFSIL